MNCLSKKFLLFIESLICVLAITVDNSQNIAGFDSLGAAIKGNSISNGIIFLAVFWYLIKHNQKRSRPIYGRVSALMLGVIYALIMYFGNNLSHFDTVWPNGSSLFNIVVQFIIFFGYTILFTHLTLFIFSFLDNFKTKNRSSVPYSLLKTFLLFLILWGVWYIILWPGIATYDTYNQIAQALGWIPLANNNPVFHTLLMSAILRPVYALTGSIQAAIGVYSLLSLCLFSLIAAWSVTFLSKTDMDSKLVKIVLYFYILNPLVGFYSVTLWKDIWISYFILFFTINCFDLIKFTGPRNFLANSKKMILFVGSILGVLYSKGTGIIIVLFALLALLICVKSKRILLTAVMLSCVLLYEGSVTVATNIFAVTEHNSADVLSVIWQPLARTVRDHKEEFTQQELKTLKELVDIQPFGDAYDSRICDPVRNYITMEPFKQNPAKYIKLWAALGIKYPKSYLDALLASGYGYYYPETLYWVYTPSSYLTTVKTFNERGLCFDPNAESYDYKIAEKVQAIRTHLISPLSCARRIPFISWFFSIGLYFEIYLLLFVYNLKKQQSLLPLYLIPLAIFISCIMSPVFAEMRYAYPAILIFPVFSAIFISDSKTHII